MVQQKLCTEPKEDPQETFRFAVAYEEVISQHQTFESGRRVIKSEPVYAVAQRKNPCTRCGLEFSRNQQRMRNAETAAQSVTLPDCANAPKVVTSGEEAISREEQECGE